MNDDEGDATKDGGHGYVFYAAVTAAVMLCSVGAALGWSAWHDARDLVNTDDLWSVRFTAAQLVATLAIAAALVAVAGRGRR